MITCTTDVEGHDINHYTNRNDVEDKYNTDEGGEGGGGNGGGRDRKEYREYVG